MYRLLLYMNLKECKVKKDKMSWDQSKISFFRLLKGQCDCLGLLPFVEHGEVDDVGELIARVGQALPVIPHIETHRLEPLRLFCRRLAAILRTISSSSDRQVRGGVVYILEDFVHVVETAMLFYADTVEKKLASKYFQYVYCVH